MQRLLLIFLACGLNGCAYYFGNTWQHSFKKIPPTEYPQLGERPKAISREALKTHPLVLDWAQREVALPEKKDKRGPERLLLAKFFAERDLVEANEYLLNMIPWGNSGTSGALNPKGDYDFTTILLCAILHQFESDTTVLWKRTSEHIARNLLIEEGGRPHTRTPRTIGIMKDTENHILMTNISQYLKNQWMAENGGTDTKYDNVANGMEQFLLDNLSELQRTGQYEFNSKPYEGYTISALLVLQAYAHSKKLKEKATETLDNICWEYIQTSHGFRKNSPFRRRMERANGTSLTDNPSSNMMKAWFLEWEKGVFDVEEIPGNHHQALAALVFPYRPPTKVWNVDDSERLILIGHGKGSSPEIHSRGKGFMLSAGGFQRGEASQIAAVPTVLMLADGAVDRNACFHIPGKGKWQKWNNSGVHHRFAVGRRAVHIPEQYQAVDSLGNWKLFRPTADVTVITYSEADLGLIFLPRSEVPLSALALQNPDPANGTFITTEGTTIGSDVKAAKGKWVIRSVDGKEVDRKTDGWPRVQIH